MSNMTPREKALDRLSSYISASPCEPTALAKLLDAYVHAKVEEMVTSEAVLSLQTTAMREHIERATKAPTLP